jgi:hypothetical protein
MLERQDERHKTKDVKMKMKDEMKSDSIASRSPVFPCASVVKGLLVNSANRSNRPAALQ